jgi:MFS transporter, AAHS family, 4-hydroxybenzoate transporter
MERINVTDVIDRAAVSALQVRIFVLCFVVSMLDGFDTQSIAFVAPSIGHEWGMTPGQFGTVFSATLFGTALGAAVLGRLSDRYGRRRLVSLSVVLFGLATLGCALSRGFSSLVILRVIAGIGLGGAIPNFLAYASEYAPERSRATIVVVTLWGFPAGAVLGGLLSSVLITRFGWQAVFCVGGLLPVLLVPLLWWLLPESIRFLTLLRNSSAEVASILRRIDPSRQFIATADYALAEEPPRSRHIRAVFQDGLAPGTILLGGALCVSLLITYLLVNWIPMLFHQIGMPIGDAVLGSSVLNAGGIVGSFLSSRLIDRSRQGVRVMAVCYVLAAFAVAAIGSSGGSRTLIMASTCLVGVLLIGTQMSLTAYIADFYPSALRATGIGLTQAMGRIGSLLGPLVGGALLVRGVPPLTLFRLGMVPALVAAGALMLLQRFMRARHV